MRFVIGLLLVMAIGLDAAPAAAQASEPPAPAASASPPPPAAATPRTRRRAGLIVAGAVLDGLGIIGLIAGVELVIAGSQERCISLYSACRSDAEIKTAGIGTLIASGALLSLGTPLFVMGLRKIPATGSLRPAVVVGSRSGALRWSF